MRFLSACQVAGTFTLGVMTACSTAVPTETPGVERLGTAVLRYTGPELEAVLGYRFAGESVGDEWLLLDLAATATADPVEIKRERVFVRAPNGDTIPLATQQEFAQAYSQLRSTNRRADIAGDPLDYFKARIPCGLQFFAAPGEGIVFPVATVDSRRVCSGRLFFYVPGGIQPGHWVLGIDLVESRVRIPFTL